jgi:hypothetical protein
VLRQLRQARQQVRRGVQGPHCMRYRCVSAVLLRTFGLLCCLQQFRLQLLAYMLLQQQHSSVAVISQNTKQVYEATVSAGAGCNTSQSTGLCAVLSNQHKLPVVFHAAGLRTHLPRHTMSCTTTHTAWT